MAFPSETGSRADALNRAWIDARAMSGAVKSKSIRLRDHCAAGAVNAEALLAHSRFLASALQTFKRASAVPGINAYAQEQLSDASLDIVAELGEMTAATSNVIAWLYSNLPTDGGYLLACQLPANGVFAWREFSPAETEGFRAELDALINAID